MERIKLIVKKTFSLNGRIYDVNDEIEIDNVADLVALNEKGFIESLNSKQLQDYADKIKNKNTINRRNKED